MTIFLILALGVSSAMAAESPAVQTTTTTVPMDVEIDTFDEDMESVSEKIRQLIFASRMKKQVRKISVALSNHDPDAAQKALDELVQGYPELKKDEPLAIDFHQSSINFWRKDFQGAYKGFDEAIKSLEKDYPKGFPQDKYWKANTAFMADLYFGRAASSLHQGKPQQAVQDFDKAISTTSSPKASLYGNKCRALLQMKKYKEASETLDLAYGISSKWVEAAEDSDTICKTLKKNGFQPKACSSGSAK